MNDEKFSNLKIIFLDIDGVLNNDEYLNWYIEHKNELNDTYSEEIDEVCVQKLLTFLQNHNDCRLVISSSWRHFDVASTVNYFNKYKFLKELCPYIVGVTERLFSIRGKEINKFVNDNDVKEYVIIDDDSDMLESQLGRFVQTSYDYGLRDDSILEKIENILYKN